MLTHADWAQGIGDRQVPRAGENKMAEGGAAHLLVIAGSGTADGSQGGAGCKAAEGEGLQGPEGRWQGTRW